MDAADGLCQGDKMHGPSESLQKASFVARFEYMANVTVEVPEEVFVLAGVPEGSTSDQAAKLLALELFREGRASLGRAAELAGVSVDEFMDFSGRRQVAIHYVEDDLVEDRETAARLKV
jgi:predicted HTH domain antitoxin